MWKNPQLTSLPSLLHKGIQSSSPHAMIPPATGQSMPTWIQTCSIPRALLQTSIQVCLPARLRVFSLIYDPPIDVTSSIIYSSSASVTDLGSVDNYHDVNDTGLVPVVVVSQPPADRTISLEFEFDTMTDGTNHAVINNITYNSPLTPAILSELTLGPNATVASAYGPQSFVLNHLDVVDLVVKNADTGKHPLYVSFLTRRTWTLTSSVFVATFMVIKFRLWEGHWTIHPMIQL